MELGISRAFITIKVIITSFRLALQLLFKDGVLILRRVG